MRLVCLIFLLTMVSLTSGESYFVTLRENESFDDFYASDAKYPESLRVKDHIKNIFSIGKFKGFVGDFSTRLIDRLSMCPYVSEITPDITVHLLGIRVQEGAARHLSRISLRKRLSKKFRYIYDESASGKGINAYVIDSGIALDHPEFEGRAKFGADFTDQGSGDSNGHGTHVAGLIGSKTYGVAKNVNIIEVKSLKAEGSGSLSTIIAALDYATSHRRKSNSPGVANLSLGAMKNTILNKAVEAAVDDGLIVIAAAGNSNKNACRYSPGSSTSAITVGSIDDKNDALAYFSNWGECVDILAPGSNVKSVNFKLMKVPLVLSGTSMSSPIITGIVANLLSDGVDPSDVRDVLLNMATKGKVKKTSMLFKGGTPNSIAYMDSSRAETDTESDYDTDFEIGHDDE